MPPCEAEGGNRNDIILQRALLPAQGQKLSEAFIVNLSDGSILLTEKKYEVNGEKRFYFSELFLECHAPLSQKSKLDIVTRAVEQVNKKVLRRRSAGTQNGNKECSLYGA